MPRRTADRAYRRARARLLAASTICWICGQPGADTADHIVPAAHLPPGDERHRDINNLRPAHRSCNSRRGTGLPRKQQQLPTSRQW